MNNKLQKSLITYKSHPIRLAIPSKGRMEVETQDFLQTCGFNLTRKDRQYTDYIQRPLSIQLVYQRQVDIVRGVLNGTLELGIVGNDLVCEHIPIGENGLVVILDSLNFGTCSLEIGVPDEWIENTLQDIKRNRGKVKVATKFPKLTKNFLEFNGISYELVEGNGSLEVYPELGYCDIIVDLVSTGQTLKDNRLKRVKNGCIMKSEAVLIGNRTALRDMMVLKVTRELIEYFEASLRAKKFVSVFVNMRGQSKENVIKSIFSKKGLKGLQGPTISPVYTQSGEKMYAIHIIVEKSNLKQAINNLRSIGGSGVVVIPTLYIFEEESLRYKELIKKIGIDND